MSPHRPLIVATCIVLGFWLSLYAVVACRLWPDFGWMSLMIAAYLMISSVIWFALGFVGLGFLVLLVRRLIARNKP